MAMIAILLLLSAVSCFASGLEVGVYLRSSGGAPPPVLDAMKSELTGVLNRAGFRLKWWMSSGSPSNPIEAEELVVVDIRGTCDSRPKLAHRPTLLRPELASTSVVGSQILPFSTLDCTALNDLMSIPLERTAPRRRDAIYGRAMGRVLAHEFYHVLLHTHKHTAKGIAKAAHSADDLTADQFDFDAGSLAQLRRVSASTHSVLAAKNHTGPAAPEGSTEPAVVAPTTEAVSGRQEH